MMPTKRRGLGRLFAAVCLLLPAAAHAGPYVNVMQPCDCPPTHYSAMHVLTPSFYRWAAWCQGPCRYTFAPILHPDIAPVANFNPYHCPAVNPLQFSVNHYVGLRGPPPSSTYQSPPAAAKKSPEKGPQLLPPPKEEAEKK
jgi:hypothetical protein